MPPVGCGIPTVPTYVHTHDTKDATFAQTLAHTQYTSTLPLFGHDLQAQRPACDPHDCKSVCAFRLSSLSNPARTLL